MKTIVAAIDFSANTTHVASAAIKLGREIEAQIVLLHVASPPSSIRDVLPVVDTVEQRNRSVNRAAEENLAEIKRMFHRSYPAIVTLVCTGPAAETIAEQAERLGAEYIVIGSHGHSAAHDLLLGSVAAGVLKRAHQAIVVVPAAPRALHESAPAGKESESARSG